MIAAKARSEKYTNIYMISIHKDITTKLSNECLPIWGEDGPKLGKVCMDLIPKIDQIGLKFDKNCDVYILFDFSTI